jgi:hypothetical protein
MTDKEIDKLAKLIADKIMEYEELGREIFLNQLKGLNEGENITIVGGIDYDYKSHSQILNDRLDELEKGKNNAIREERFEDVIEISKLIEKVKKEIIDLKK